MGKARTDKRGQTREQRLQRENEALKRQISSLRRSLARIDLDRYSTVKDIIEEHYKEEKAQEGQQILENIKKTWQCKDCMEGHLEIFIYSHSGKTFYYRICSNAPSCRNRTLSKPYDPLNVTGIVKKGRD